MEAGTPTMATHGVGKQGVFTGETQSTRVPTYRSRKRSTLLGVLFSILGRISGTSND